MNFENYVSLTTLSNSKGNNLQVCHFIIAADKEKHPGYTVKKIDPNIQWHDKAKGDPNPKAAAHISRYQNSQDLR